MIAIERGAPDGESVGMTMSPDGFIVGPNEDVT